MSSSLVGRCFARSLVMEIERRNLRQRAAALSRVITTMVARKDAGISEPALAEATALPNAAVLRILRRLAWRTLVRRVSRNTWAVAAFVTHGYELQACPIDL
jgi:DNA-binding GntR family transcriptional regulator